MRLDTDAAADPHSSFFSFFFCLYSCWNPSLHNAHNGLHSVSGPGVKQHPQHTNLPVRDATQRNRCEPPCLRCRRARSRNHVNAPLGHGEASLSDCDRSETQLAHVVLSLISFRATHPVGVEKIIKPSIGLFHLPGGLPPAGHLLTYTNVKASWRA